MDNSMANIGSLILQVIAALNGSRGRSVENEENLRRMMREVINENSTSSQDRAMLQNLMHLLESCVGKQQSELQAVAQDRATYKAQVDELTRKVDELMKKEKDSSPTQSDLSVMAKMEVLKMLQKYKQERKQQRYNEATNYAPEPQLPWAGDIKKPHQMKQQQQQQHSGGAYGKFDRQNRPGYHDQGRRRMDGNDNFVMVDYRDCNPKYQRSPSQHKPSQYNHQPQNDNFHKFSMPNGNRGGAYHHNFGHQNFSHGEYGDKYQQTGNRGGKQMGSYNGDGRSGPHFSRGGGHQFGGSVAANQAGYANKQFQRGGYSPNNFGHQNQGSGSGNHYPRGQFHNRGQGRGQFHGRGNFHNKGPFQQNQGQTPNKEDGKKSEQDANLNGLPSKELEIYTQLFLQFQQQQEALKKGQENNDASGKSTFKKKRRSKNKKKAKSNTRVNEKERESEEDSDDDSDSAEEASPEAASDSKGVKKKTIKSVEDAKESDSARDFEIFLASDFDLPLDSGINSRKLKDIVMIARKDDDVMPFVPKTVKELLDFKEKHPNAEVIITKKKK